MAAATVRSTISRSASAPSSVEDADVVRPSLWMRRCTSVAESATFWWMYELANRVRACARELTETSTSAAGPADARASSSTREASSSSD